MYPYQRYSCELTEEDLSKAVMELNEPEENCERLARIDQLRDAFIVNEEGLELSRSDDLFLLRFLRAKKFNHKNALKMLTNYHRQRKIWPEVFDRVKSPILIKQVLDAGCFVKLKGKALDGSTVCIGRPGKVEAPLMIDFLALLVLSMDYVLEEEQAQIYGVTVVHDLSFFGFDLVKQMGPMFAKRFVHLLQDSVPMRLKGLNMVHEPKIFDIAFSVLRQFMKEKMKKRVHFHGSMFDSLHKIIDQANLPEAYGGTGEDLDGNLAEEWKGTVIWKETCI